MHPTFDDDYLQEGMRVPREQQFTGERKRQ